MKRGASIGRMTMALILALALSAGPRSDVGAVAAAGTGASGRASVRILTAQRAGAAAFASPGQIAREASVPAQRSVIRRRDEAGRAIELRLIEMP